MRFGPGMIARAERVFAAQRPGRVVAIGALTGGGGDRGIDRSRYFRRGPGRAKALGVERHAHPIAMQTGDEHGQREAFGGADPGKTLRLKSARKLASACSRASGRRSRTASSAEPGLMPASASMTSVSAGGIALLRILSNQPCCAAKA